MVKARKNETWAYLLGLFFGFLAIGAAYAQVDAPEFDPSEYRYPVGFEVTVTCATAGATIHYTTNGVDPIESDPVVGSGNPISIVRTTVLKARAYDSSSNASAVTSQTFSVTGLVAAGSGHSFGMRYDGKLYAWGLQTHGALGDGISTSTIRSSSAPVLWDELPFLNAVDASAGAGHGLAIDTDANLWAWGLNASGQLGNNTTVSSGEPVQVIKSTTPGDYLEDVVLSSAGTNFSLALTLDGKVWAWGTNALGQLGDGTTTSRSYAGAVTEAGSGTPDLASVLEVDAGKDHSLALVEDGTIWAWGDNASGQLGDGTTTGRTRAVKVQNLVSSSPLVLEDFDGVTSVSAGGNHSALIRQATGENGTVWSWGEQLNGALGNGQTSAAAVSYPEPVEKSGSVALDGIVQISAGVGMTLALDSSGKVWAWGNNSHGALGDGGTTHRAYAAKVLTGVSTELSNIQWISAGGATYGYSLAIDSTGKLYSWGYNGDGALGDGTTTDRLYATLVGPFFTDSDNDGLDDAWEALYFGDLDETSAGDPDGDGFTMLREFEANSDPSNYYQQPGTTISPVLTLISGNNQTGDPGTMAALPLIIEVTDGTNPLINAPVTFSVSESETGQVSLVNTGTGLASSVTVNTNSSGRAQVYFYFPETFSTESTIEVSAADADEVEFDASTGEILMSGLSLWLKADAGVTVDGSNGVSTWGDQSSYGKNLTQATASYRPTKQTNQLNGHPVIRFDGSNDNIAVSSTSGWGSSQFTVVMLIKPNNTTNYNQQIRAAGGWGQFYFHTDANGGIYVGTTDATRMVPGSGAGQIPNGTVKASQWQMFALTFNSGAGKFYKNGLLTSSKTLATPATWTGFELGVVNTGTINGDLAELIIYSDELDSQGLQDVAAYFSEKYALQFDTDGEGMPDSYEIANGLNPLVNDGLYDKDGDRVPNLWEYYKGTAANDEEDIPAWDYVVDPAHAADSSTDNIVATIGAAVSAAPALGSGGVGHSIIYVKPGDYAECVDLVSTKAIALLAETGGDPVRLLGNTTVGYSVLNFAGKSVADGFRITRPASTIAAGSAMGPGVGVSNGANTARLANSIIIGQKWNYTGGVYVVGGNFVVDHCTVTKNITTGSSGSGLYVSGTAKVEVRSSIFWNDQNPSILEVYKASGATVATAYSIIRGGLYGGTNVNPELQFDGLVQSGSPAIGAGDPASGLLTDIHGEVRPGGLVSDVGADEFVDTDSDDLPDNWEMEQFGDLDEIATGDPDGDGLTNAEEYEIGTAPQEADSDDDGANDGAEITAGTNPWIVDTDGEGMPDGYEITNGLSPLVNDGLYDKDGDQVPNLWEYYKGTAANDEEDIPAWDYVVDPAHAADSSTDNIVATIGAAVSAAPALGSGGVGHSIVYVKPGDYAECVDLVSTKAIALLAETGGDPVRLLGNTTANYSVLNFAGKSVADGFRITRPASTIAAGSAMGPGVGVSNGANTARLANCIVIDQKWNHTGGLYVVGGNFVVDHCTVTKNITTGSSGSGLYVSGTAKVEVRSSIFWNDQNPSILEVYKASGATVTTAYSIVRGGLYGGTNVNPELRFDGLVQAGSPVINAGDPASGLMTDIHGEVRPGGMVRDMGADEFVDTDSDGLPDNLEMEYFGDLDETATGDSDGDGLTNAEEYEIGTAPQEADSDDDGANDGAEITAGTNPWIVDTDGEGMPDGYEITNGLNPLVNDGLYDKDGDRVPNLWEYYKGTAANDEEDIPAWDYVVDPAHAADSSTDNIVATIGAAVSAAPALGSGGVGHSIIYIKPGDYAECVDLVSTKAIALLAETGSDPVRLLGNTTAGYSVLNFAGKSVADGFRITRPASTIAAGSAMGPGVGVSNGANTARLANSIVIDQKWNYTGGVYVIGGNFVVDHCTVTKNITTGSSGSGLYVSGTAKVEVRSSIFWNDQNPSILEVYKASGATVTTSYSIIRGALYSGTNVNPELRLDGLVQAGSPVINAGDPASGLMTDIHGEVRPGGMVRDMGADEFVDTDSDDLPDNWEMQYFEDLDETATGDPDGDKLINSLEFAFDFNPANFDTDGNRQSDLYDALFLTTHPANLSAWHLDTDDDGLTDGWELYWGTDSELSDTNGDGISDVQSLAFGIDPLEEDHDGDGVSNADELLNGTDVFWQDTDGDGVNDDTDAFPFDPNRSAPLEPQSGDTTVPTITITEPTDAVLIP